MVREKGPELSHEMYPRAKIFRREQATVVDMQSMQALMRYSGMYLGEVSYCLSNAMHSIGHSIKSPECPCVRACVRASKIS